MAGVRTALSLTGRECTGRVRARVPRTCRMGVASHVGGQIRDGPVHRDRRGPTPRPASPRPPRGPPEARSGRPAAPGHAGRSEAWQDAGSWERLRGREGTDHSPGSLLLVALGSPPALLVALAAGARALCQARAQRPLAPAPVALLRPDRAPSWGCGGHSPCGVRPPGAGLQLQQCGERVPQGLEVPDHGGGPPPPLCLALLLGQFYGFDF